MKKIFLLLSFCVSINASYILDPYLGFPIGLFEGFGHCYDDKDRYSEYPAFLDMAGFDWVSGTIREGVEQRFEWFFTATDYNQFDIDVTMYEHPGDEGVDYKGNGVCFDYECHLEVDIENGVVQEILYFYPEGIHKIGRMHFTKEDKEHYVNWEEFLDIL